ncbi:MAG: hypothetical protein EON54_14215, partial [Alcaligenaceae bacterium]
RSPNFRNYFIGHSLSTLGTWIQQVTLAWIIYDLHQHSGGTGRIRRPELHHRLGHTGQPRGQWRLRASYDAPCGAWSESCRGHQY